MQVPLAIIEDQPAIREALHTYLCAQPEFDCVLVAESVEELLADLAAGAPKPRLVLSDIGLPGMSGIAGIAQLHELAPQAEVVLITVYQDAERIFKAMCAGAVGYLVKTTPLPEIKQALLDVLAGGSPMSPAVARHVMRYFRPAAPTNNLTAREQQIVEALEQGLSYKLVADRLGISINTVRAYIRSVYDKLQINSKAELLRRSKSHL
ncbi:response regulator transcription factor [Hymenobacter mucosus]|nr:response regulator transcription factor [Hymenobacter mucosus]